MVLDNTESTLNTPSKLVLATPLMDTAFAPIVVIDSFTDMKAALAAVDDSIFGLQAGIFTPDIQRAFQAARKLEVGGVMINDIPMYRADHMPYGGIKQSGIGREGPRYAIEEMTEPKLICWKL